MNNSSPHRYGLNRPAGIPRPAGSRCHWTAGLLACGSSLHAAFPVSQWLCWRRNSPLTVAGAATVESPQLGRLLRVPFWSPSFVALWGTVHPDYMAKKSRSSITHQRHSFGKVPL